jgi:hypothetical protein
MKKISYQYLIKELGLTPEQIQKIVLGAQESFGKTLIMIDDALVEKRPSAESEFEAFLPFKVQFELELESNYFSTDLSNFSIEQLI